MKTKMSLIYSILMLLFLSSCSAYRSKAKYKDIPPMTITHVKIEMCIPDIHEDEASIQYTNSISEFKPGIL